ncbi:MAG TPA: metallophosphoesterase [Acidimicrobiales bacterium]|nr:metallophosphoesterase [Acidimicrobiales bacterium]
MPSTFEPYVQLVDVTATSALVAWGGFLLEPCGESWRARRTGETFGVMSEPVGRAAVEVLDGDGRIVAREAVDDANHVWVEGLEPATTYRYRVVVDGAPWAGGDRHDWAPEALQPAVRPLDLRLRTHAAADEPDPVTFIAVGDTGVGLAAGEDGRRQLAVARTMQRLADAFDVRFVVMLGDTIYHGPGGPTDQSGAHDDDWWLTYFQPYRYLVDHLAVYPTAGNHDGSDDEDADDRAQLEDNLYLATRFGPRAGAGRASLDPGLFYKLQVGALLELVCIDTTWGAERGEHWFDEPKHRRWLEEAFASASDDVVWRVPFSHHPAWSAGPNHASMDAQIERVVPLYRRGGARLVLSGHEHNFQHGRADDLDYVISGAGGKLDERPPRRTDEVGTQSWAASAHCLLVHATPETLTVVPFGATPPGGQPVPLIRRRSDGSPVDEPIVLPRG